MTGLLRRRTYLPDRELRRSYDVVIIGGGANGLSLAYHLAAEHRIRDVAVFSTAVAAPEAIKETLPLHLEYMIGLEKRGLVFASGPLTDEGGEPRAIVEARGLRQVTDLSAIDGIVDAIVAANPDKVAQVKAKPALVGWFVGQVMKATGGKANPQAVNDRLKEKLGL